MEPRYKKPLTLLAVIMAIAIGMSGCGQAPSQAQVVYPTVVIVQYVTQVVATVTPAPASAQVQAAATATPAPANFTINGFDPFAQPLYYPIKGCQVASRLHAGERAFVANGASQLGLHASANIGYAPMFRKLEPGEILDVVGGPHCQRLSLVWEVIASDGRRGFVAEGDGNETWLLPYGEAVDKDVWKPTQNPNKAIKLGLPADCRPR